MSQLNQETIIKTYMDLLGHSPWADVSMSTLAKELGVSKPALYHYFKGKDALDAAAFELTRRNASELLEIQYAKSDREKAILVGTFLIRHRQEALFLLQRILAIRLSEGKFKAELRPFQKISFTDIFYVSYFTLLTIDGSMKTEKQVATNVDWMSRLFEKGLGASSTLEDFSFCQVTQDDLGDSRYVTALDKVVRTYGLQSLSIGKFADALGVAPSTLYSTFKNKEDMLFQIAKIEFNRFCTAIEKRIKPEYTLADTVSVVFHTVDSYARTQAATARFIDSLSIAFLQDQSFVGFPGLTRLFDSLEKEQQGFGGLVFVLPIAIQFAEEAGVNPLSVDEGLDILLHGNKEDVE